MKSRSQPELATTRWKLSEWTRPETYGAEAVIPLLTSRFTAWSAGVETCPV